MFQTVSNKMGNTGGADPVRRLSRAVLPQLPRSSLGETGNPSGGYERRPSILVGNMLQGYGRRMSRMDNACYVSNQSGNPEGNQVFQPKSAQPRARLFDKF